MEKIDKIKMAKSFIDQLAMGRNPLDGSCIPEEEVVNQVRVSRCLFYVSSLLSEMIERENTPPPSEIESYPVKEAKKTFYLTEEQIQSFAVSEKPIAVKNFMKKLNASRSADVSPVAKQRFQLWLTNLGILTSEVDENGKKTLRLTEFATELGMYTTQIVGAYGEYDCIYCPKDAQAYMIDNIYGLFELSKKAENHLKPWTPEDHQRMVEMYEAGKSIYEIGITLSRTKGSVQRRLWRYGLLK